MAKDPNFDRRLDAALQDNQIHEEEAEPDQTASGLAMGMRIGIEFTVGIAGGALIGWWLDKWLGTAPWLLVLFVTLGFGAGLANVYRVMNNIGEGIGLNRPPKT